MMPSTVLPDTPPEYIIKLRFTYTETWPNASALVDMDGAPIARMEFASLDAQRAFQAFMLRMVAS